MKFEKGITRILEKLHENGDKFTKKEDLEKVKISNNKLDELINYLSHKKLVIVDGTSREWRISPDGREYLINYKTQKRQEEFNKIVALTGAILAIIGTYTFIKDLGLITEERGWITTIFFALTLVCLAPIIGFIVNNLLDN